jgi:hypothetical protein
MRIGVIPALPVLYFVGALIWNVTGASDGAGPRWPVTLVYTMMFTGVAVGNTGLVLAVLRWMRLRRQTKSSAGSSDRIRTRSYHGADVALAARRVAT